MAPEQLDIALLPKRFLALFPQRFGSTFRALGGTAWRAMSQFHYLEDDSILGSLGGSSKNIRACLLDKKTSYLALSCETGDEGIDFEGARIVVKQLQDAGLKPNIYKESGSNAVQIFLAFSEPIETDYAAHAIASLLKNETVVIHDTETPFVLPLQQGFAWLNDDFSIKVECDQIAIEPAMAMFLHDLHSNSVPSDILERLGITEETLCTTATPVVETIELTEFKVPQPIADETLTAQQEAALDTHNQESAHINPPPAELPGVATQVQVPGGRQLLLFPVDSQVVQFEVPKERPKRKKRARSDLPADAQPEISFPSLFSVFPTDAQGVMQPSKEAHDN